MEEILASIRRIIADDQSLPGRAASPDAPFDFRPAGEVAAEPAGLAEKPMPVSEATTAQVSKPALEPAIEPEPLHPLVHLLRPPIEAQQGTTDVGHPPVANVETPHAEHDEVRHDRSFVAHGPIAAPQYVSPAGPIFAGANSDLAASSSYEDADPTERQPDFVTGSDFIMREEIVDRMTANAPPIQDVPVARAATPVTRQASEEAIIDPPALFSAATNDSVASAFHLLAASRLADNTDELLALSRDMIRPLLKTWLDDNLPSMVERLVRAEIERVARGPR